MPRRIQDLAATFRRPWWIAVLAACCTSTNAANLAATPPAAPLMEVVAWAPSDDEPIKPLPTVEQVLEEFEDDNLPAVVELGRRLFHDPRLSHDDTLSCASCHDLRYFGIDRARHPIGIQGQVGAHNTPTVYNAALQVAQFWDGRAQTLEDQAAGPTLAIAEMGSTREEILAKLRADRRTVDAFRAAFPDMRDADGMTFGQVVQALVAFEATLVTPGGRFDRWLAGDADRLTRAEVEGYRLFKEVGCATCHYGPAVGGKTFQRLGAKVSYFQGRHIADIDRGRFNLTKDDRDLHAFKVPTLRNVAETAPYLHDGSIATLEEVVRTMAHYQLGIDLDDHRVARIAAFLRALTTQPSTTAAADQR